MALRSAAVRSSGIRDAVRGLRKSLLESGLHSALSRTCDEPLGGDDRTFMSTATDLACVVRSRDLEEKELSLSPDERRCSGNRRTGGSGGRVLDVERDANGELARAKMRAENTRGCELHESHHPRRCKHRREGVVGAESTGEIRGRYGETGGGSGVDCRFAHAETPTTNARGPRSRRSRVSVPASCGTSRPATPTSSRSVRTHR